MLKSLCILIYYFGFDGCIIPIDKIRNDDHDGATDLSYQSSAITNNILEFTAANALIRLLNYDPIMHEDREEPYLINEEMT